MTQLSFDEYDERLSTLVSSESMKNHAELEAPNEPNLKNHFPAVVLPLTAQAYESLRETGYAMADRYLHQEVRVYQLSGTALTGKILERQHHMLFLADDKGRESRVNLEGVVAISPKPSKAR
jgi:hypothetical protein